MIDASNLLLTVQQSVFSLLASYKNSLQKQNDHLVLVIDNPSFFQYQKQLQQIADAFILALTACIRNSASKEAEISDWYNLVNRLLLCCELVLPANELTVLWKQLDEAGTPDKEVTDLVCKEGMQLLMNRSLTRRDIQDTHQYIQKHPNGVIRAKDLYVMSRM